MPTLFYIIPKDSNISTTDLNNTYNKIKKNLDKLHFKKVKYNVNVIIRERPYKRILIEVHEANCWDSSVKSNARDYAFTYLSTLQLSDSFDVKVITSLNKFSEEDYIRSTSADMETRPTFTIVLRVKNEGPSPLSKTQIVENVEEIRKEIKEILGNTDLVISSNYNEGNAIYYLKFINQDEGDEDSLLFKGDVIYQALVNKNLTHLFEISNFKHNRYLEYKEKQKQTTLTQVDADINNNNNTLSTGNPVMSMGDLHDKLMKKIKSIIGSDKIYDKIINTLNQREYTQALILICREFGDLQFDNKIFYITQTLLSYKDPLKIKINEQTGDIRYSALHYVALKHNSSLYTLLIKHGANPKLINSSGQTPENFFFQTGKNTTVDKFSIKRKSL